MSESHNIACKEHEIPPATFSETQGGIQVTFTANLKAQPESRLELQPESGTQVAMQVTEQDNALLNSIIQKLKTTSMPTNMQVTTQVAMQVIKFLQKIGNQELTRQQIQELAKLENREHFRKAYLKPLLEAGYLEMTIPEKPNSRLQKYRLTSKGKLTWEGMEP
jgi:hypothetical protein